MISLPAVGVERNIVTVAAPPKLRSVGLRPPEFGTDVPGVGRASDPRNTTRSIVSGRRPNIVGKWAALRASQQLLPDMAVAGCFRDIISTADRAEVVQHRETHRARFQKVQACGSVWTCPVCAPRIVEQRQDDIGQALAWARAGGYTVLFASYTCQHNKWRYLPNGRRELVRLFDVLEALLEARRHMHGRTRASLAAWSSFAEVHGYVGTIRAMEITHGDRGWHPHLHELIILRPGADVAAAIAALQEMWMASLAAVGLTGRLPLACTVRESGWTEEEYIAKFEHKRPWDVDAELARGHVKKARKGNMTPWDLLELAAAGDERAGVLFREYARATFRRNHVTWSPGLKKLAGVVEQSDQTVAAADVSPLKHELVGLLTRLAFRQMRLHSLEGVVLHVVETQGWVAVQQLLGRVHVPAAECPAPTVLELEAFARGPGAVAEPVACEEGSDDDWF